MFVYNRRHSDLHLRPSWVTATRIVAFAVIVAIAWPLTGSAGDLRLSLAILAASTAGVVALQVAQRRWALPLLGGLIRAAQFACELVVISQIVYSTGGMRSPSIFLYLVTIVSAAASHRLIGTLLVASVASVSYIMVVWVSAGHTAALLRPAEWLGTVQQLSDDDFFTVFVRLCIFFLCAFTSGFLAERLSTNDEVLAHTTEALKVAKLETGDILKHLQSGILTVDLAGHIVYFNRAAEDILGAPVRRVRGRPLRDVFGQQFPELVDRLEGVLASRKMDIRTELTIRRADGRIVPLGISTSVLGGAGGQPRGVIGIFQDLTEAKQIEERMRAQDRLAAIGELSAAIAHEIRNPLAAISGSVEVLRNELSLDGENQKLLALIIKESDRLNKILTDFLMYARIRPTVSGRVCVGPVLDDVFELARRRFDGRPGVAFRARQFDSSLAVRADADHLKQLLINLIFNAIEAIDHKDGEVLVTVLTRPPDPNDRSLPESPDGWVEISVKDNGSGIPESVRARLFEPFVSSKATGTGLGLAIVARLAQHADGKVQAESIPGEGSIFTVLLPRFASVDDAEAGRFATAAKPSSAVASA